MLRTVRNVSVDSVSARQSRTSPMSGPFVPVKMAAAQLWNGPPRDVVAVVPAVTRRGVRDGTVDYLLLRCVAPSRLSREQFIFLRCFFSTNLGWASMSIGRVEPRRP